MGLSLLHQTVNPVGSSFTPNLLLYGWYTLYWNCATADLVITAPSNGSDGQEFVIDIIRTGTMPDPGHVVLFQSVIGGKYWSATIEDQSPISQVGPWRGEQVGLGALHGVRHRFLLLNDCCALEAYNPIVAY